MTEIPEETPESVRVMASVIRRSVEDAQTALKIAWDVRRAGYIPEERLGHSIQAVALGERGELRKAALRWCPHDTAEEQDACHYTNLALGLLDDLFRDLDERGLRAEIASTGEEQGA